MQEVLYGRRPVYETLRAGRRRVRGVFLRSSAKPCDEVDEIVRLATQSGVAVGRIDEARLEKMVGEVNHQGVAVQVSEYPYAALEDVVEQIEASPKSALVLVLDHLEDPQNVGSILRTADAVGVQGVIIPKDRAVGVTPAVVRASAGASEHIRVVMVTNLVRTMKLLQQKGVWFTGLDASPEARLYTEVDLKDGVGLVIGNEGHGLSRLVRETCDFLVRLPMCGRVSSLNAGVAGAIALYEVRRQRASHEGNRSSCL